MSEDVLVQALAALVRGDRPRPARAWARQVADAGYQDVAVQPLHEYWSSPAFLLTARGGA